MHELIHSFTATICSRRALVRSDLNDSLARMIHGGEHTFLDAIHNRMIDVAGLVGEVYRTHTAVAIGTIDVGIFAHALLGIRPGESMNSVLARCKRDGAVRGIAFWDWRRAVALAGMTCAMRTPAIAIGTPNAVNFVDGHHRLAAHAFRQDSTMPVALIDDPQLVQRHSRRLMRTRRPAWSET